MTTVSESYITHIRITEFSSHPSSPPPPASRTPETEKPRVIIVAVRKSGRVRMHKSKENPNGTFSIGKTWNLDDLSQIDSFTSSQVNPHNREWAGETGFLVTLGRPYFWQAQTDKEKKFFIASLVKIYGKYTSGKTPELVGFDPKELDQVLGAGAGRRPPPGQPPRPPMPTDPVGRLGQQRTPPSTGSGPAPPPVGGTMDPRFQRGPGPGMRPPNPSDSPAGSFDSTTSHSRPPRPPFTQQNNKSQDSVAASFVSASSFISRGEENALAPTRSRNGMNGPTTPGRFPDPRDTSDSPRDAPPVLGQTRQNGDGIPPERRRPPMDPSRPLDRDLVPPPLMSPVKKDSPALVTTRSSEKLAQEPSAATTAADTTTMERQRHIEPVPPSSAGTPSAVEQIETEKGLASAGLKPTDELLDEPAEDDTRPGLSSMLKSKKSKNEIAGMFWKAANTHAAFKPRRGGAGDRLLMSTNNTDDGPDGINGVVPAPPRIEKRPQTPEPAPTPIQESPVHPAIVAPPTPLPQSETQGPVVPELQVTEPNASAPIAVADAQREAAVAAVPPTPSEQPNAAVKGEKKAQSNEAANAKDNAKQATRRSIIAGNDSKYLQSLGIEPTILDDRSHEFGKWLDYFGWVPGVQMRSRNADELKVDIDRELNKAQAGGWLARFREDDERVHAIKSGVDLAMAECEELDNLLTLYSVELSTLSDDIAYIEAQGQGLQVQTSNQKLLKKELESLLETCAITPEDLEALRIAPLDHLRGLEDVESALVILYKAMLKIDPTLHEVDLNPSEDQDKPDPAAAVDKDYGKMRIVREKKEMYMQESGNFMRRLVEFMARQFEEASTETKRTIEGALSRKVDPTHHDAGRDLLSKYSPLMLYARDADLDNWNRMMQIYQDMSHPVYKQEFQGVVAVWRKNARKLTGEESELLFTSHVEKQQEGVATAARKMTVKRSQTLARALRSPLADGHRTSVDKSAARVGSLPYEVFLGALDDLLPLVEAEQNFVIDFFHATTLEQADFPDSVAANVPRDRRCRDLKRHRLMEPDRELARRVTRSMEIIFSFLEGELQRLMEWVIAQDPLQGAGVLAILDKKLNEIGQSNLEFSNMMLQKLHDALEGKFTKFVDEQIRAIEETKVKINKRKGVISFIRVFPAFLNAVENMLAAFDPNTTLRRTLDREYDRILKSMFDSLMVIARENPTSGSVTTGSADPEGKEALNFHILLIENMNHFLEGTEGHNLDVLDEWKTQATSEYVEHMGLYLNAVMRRPLGKLLDNLENIEAQIQAGKSPTAIARQPSNSQAVFSKVLGVYDSKEVRKGIEALRKRVEKHFGDADEPALSRGLVAKVLTECEAFYGSVETRIGQVTTDVYGGDVPFEWPRADVKAAFK